jgi:hypothetical protein
LYDGESNRIIELGENSLAGVGRKCRSGVPEAAKKDESSRGYS